MSLQVSVLSFPILYCRYSNKHSIALIEVMSKQRPPLKFGTTGEGWTQPPTKNGSIYQFFGGLMSIRKNGPTPNKLSTVLLKPAFIQELFCVGWKQVCLLTQDYVAKAVCQRL